jgi:hypothetical protein
MEVSFEGLVCNAHHRTSPVVASGWTRAERAKGRGHRAGTCRSHYAVRDVSKLRCSPLAHHPLCVCVCVWMCMCLCVCLCVHVCVRVPWAKAKVRFIYLLFCNVPFFR